MNQPLFRKSSMERISSPEQLNDYIRVTSPSVWLVLAAVVVLLAGACVWGIFGRMETQVLAPAVAQNGRVVCYVTETDAASIQAGMPVSINGGEYAVSSVSAQPVEVTVDFNSYAMYLGGFQAGDWVYAVTLDAPVSDGTYEAQIVVDSVSPLSFILN